MKYPYILILVCLLTSITFSLSGQETPVFVKSETTQTISNKKFYIHTVQAGQTLYSICKGYGIEQSDLALFNPEIFDGIKPGQVIKVPFPSALSSDAFKVHVVAKGETLYSISKKYQVSVEDITKWNPETKDGLKKGQELKIYQATENITTVKQSDNIQPEAKKNTVKFHVVQEKETLYGISKLYNTPVFKIEQYNPWLTSNTIKKGDTLLLTEEKVFEVKKSSDSLKVNPNILFPKQNSTECIPAPLNRTIKVALLLPFTEDIRNIEKEEVKIEKQPELVPTTKPFLEYYEGFLLAIDSLKSMGISVDLTVLNTNKDSATVANIVSSGKLANMDIVFGPVYIEEYKMVADFCKSAGIWSIYPLNTKKPDIDNNPYIIQVTPSYETQVMQAVRFMATFNDKNFIIVHNSNSDELNFIKVFEKELKEQFSTNFPDQKINYCVVDHKQTGLSGIEKVLHKDLENVIVLTATSQASILDMLNKLNGLTKTSKIKITFMPQWKKFENNIEFDHLFNLQATGFDPFFIDTRSPSVMAFNRTYQRYFKLFPGKFSYQGYDSGMFLISMLSKYGKDFGSCINNQKIGLLGSEFYFRKSSENGGWENQGTFIMQCYFDGEELKEYKLVGKVTDKPYRLNEVAPKIEEQKKDK